MGREIGEGYRRHAASRDDVFWTNRAVVLLNDDGTIFNAFPILRT
jgi:hypothetical protein